MQFAQLLFTIQAPIAPGLGLSISYGIIKDHQGQIEVAETGTEGTTFRIRLPIDDWRLLIFD